MRSGTDGFSVVNFGVSIWVSFVVRCGFVLSTVCINFSCVGGMPGEPLGCCNYNIDVCLVETQPGPIEYEEEFWEDLEIDDFALMLYDLNEKLPSVVERDVVWVKSIDYEVPLDGLESIFGGRIPDLFGDVISFICLQDLRVLGQVSRTVRMMIQVCCGV